MGTKVFDSDGVQAKRFFGGVQRGAMARLSDGTGSLVMPWPLAVQMARAIMAREEAEAAQPPPVARDANGVLLDCKCMSISCDHPGTALALSYRAPKAVR